MNSPAVDQTGLGHSHAGTMEADVERPQAGRVLVLALNDAVAENLSAALSDRGLVVARCADMDELCAVSGTDAGLAIIDDSQLKRSAWAQLARTLSQQPKWSDLPLIVLTASKTRLNTGGLVPDPTANALLLEQPVTLASLMSAVRVALRSRRRQYEQRDRDRRTAKLDKRVAERTRSLKASIQSLEGVLYHVAHDLRAPLRTMQGFPTILLDDHATSLGEEGAELARRIAVAASRMDKLIQDLLAYGRLAHMSLSPVMLDLNLQMQGVLELLAKEIHARKAIVRVEPPSPDVYADPGVLDLVLTHLLNNALTFVASGVTPQIQIRAERLESGMVRISLLDNGIGVAAEHHDRIFRVFERLHGNDVNTGTGIGLAIVRKGAERMGGAAGVESRPGEGSCFWLDLPAAPKYE